VGILKDLSDVLKGMKRRNQTIKLCPKCRSPKLKLSSSFDIWLTPEQYVCENCGYKGPIILEVEEENLHKTEPNH
jgi:ssDNA-binding Zn-finger/Zn-ribbon topoisomerase 1